MATHIKTGKISVTELIGLVLIGSGLLECGLGWMQLLGLRPSLHSLYPATGTFYNPGPYCGFLGMLTPIAFYYVLDSRHKVLHAASLAYLVPAVAIMPVLMGRTGWVAAVVGCILTAIGCGKLRRPQTMTLFFATIVAVMAIAFLLYLKPASALGRFFLWRTGISALSEHPLDGLDGIVSQERSVKLRKPISTPIPTRHLLR